MKFDRDNTKFICKNLEKSFIGYTFSTMRTFQITLLTFTDDRLSQSSG